jgi:hypothetical protein
MRFAKTASIWAHRTTAMALASFALPSPIVSKNIHGHDTTPTLLEVDFKS